MDSTGPSTIYEMLFSGSQDPDRNAIECPGQRPCTYRDLRQQILSVLQLLGARGLHRNDRVAIVAPAGPDTAVAILGIMAGSTAVPLNPQSSIPEYQAALSSMRSDVLILRRGYGTAAATAAELEGIPVIELVPSPHMAGTFSLEPAAGEPSGEPAFSAPSDTAILFMTSGTTAAPKIVPFTQERLCRDARRMEIYHFTKTDRHLHILPYYHLAGIKGTLLAPLISGGTVICTREFIASDFPGLLRDYRPTEYTAVPAQHQAILREIRKIPAEELRPNSLRRIRSGSSLLPGEVREGLERLLGVPVIEGYASSEAGTITVNIPPRQGSVGLVVIDDLVIVDEDGHRLGPGEPGEILVRGGTVFDGYENVPEETAVAFINGWFRTGDLGYLDRDGYLFLTGRKKELINKGGEKISPAVIDAALLSHPEVMDAMAFPIGDPMLGDEVAAMVVRTRNDLTEADLRKFLLDRLNPTMLPGRIFFVDTIPRTETGKVMRGEGTRQFSRPVGKKP